MQQPFVIAASGKAAAGKGGTPPLPTGSVGGPVRLHHRLRDAPAVAHLVTVLPGPLADRVRLLAVRASGRLGHRRLPPGAASPTGTSAGLTTVLDEGSQGLVELVGVLVRQVDLIVTVVQRERHRPDRVRAIEVIDEPHGGLLCHCALPSIKKLTGVTADCPSGPEHAQLARQEAADRVRRVTNGAASLRMGPRRYARQPPLLAPETLVVVDVLASPESLLPESRPHQPASTPSSTPGVRTIRPRRAGPSSEQLTATGLPGFG